MRRALFLPLPSIPTTRFRSGRDAAPQPLLFRLKSCKMRTILFAKKNSIENRKRRESEEKNIISVVGIFVQGKEKGGLSKSDKVEKGFGWQERKVREKIHEIAMKRTLYLSQGYLFIQRKMKDNEKAPNLSALRHPNFQ